MAVVAGGWLREWRNQLRTGDLSQCQMTDFCRRRSITLLSTIARMSSAAIQFLVDTRLLLRDWAHARTTSTTIPWLLLWGLAFARTRTTIASILLLLDRGCSSSTGRLFANDHRGSSGCRALGLDFHFRLKMWPRGGRCGLARRLGKWRRLGRGGATTRRLILSGFSSGWKTLPLTRLLQGLLPISHLDLVP